MTLRDAVVRQIKKHRRLTTMIKAIASGFSPDRVVVLDYPVTARQRWDEDHPHQQLYTIIDRNRDQYLELLQSFLPFLPQLSRIPAHPQNGSSTMPYWINGWMPALDGVALYSVLAMQKPRYYVEVGSGNSTKFARLAISEHKLDTKIVSIDPHPRAEVTEICDENIRQPAENVGMDVFDRLGPNDILYIDNSHRALMNSDATALLLDVLPRLKSGVIVEIHDVTLPYDYPKDWVDRYYSEQYVLAAYLLANGNRFEVMLPSMFVSQDKQLSSVMSPLWQQEHMKGVETHGCSFWLRMK